MVRVGIFTFFLNLEKQLFTVEYALVEALSYMAFIMLRYFPYIPNLFSGSLWKKKVMLNFLRYLSALIEMILWFILILLIWYITCMDLPMLNYPCISEINSTWSRCIILLMCCWTLYCVIFILISNILLRTFTYMFIRNIGLIMIISYNIVRRCQGNAGFIKWIWICSFLLNFL